MRDQIEERVEIADSLIPAYKWRGKRRYSKSIYWLVVMLLSTLTVVSVMSTLNIEFFTYEWANADLLVVLTMGLSLMARHSYIELMVKRHIDEVVRLDLDFDRRLNSGFATLVAKLNKRRRNIYLIGAPNIVISAAAVFKFFEVNPFWDKFPPLVFIACLYVIGQNCYDILRLKRHFSDFNTSLNRD